MGYKIQITKCYLVQVLDEDGNEVACDYSFVKNKKEAEKTGKKMINDFMWRDKEE